MTFFHPTLNSPRISWKQRLLPEPRIEEQRSRPPSWSCTGCQGRDSVASTLAVCQFAMNRSNPKQFPAGASSLCLTKPGRRQTTKRATLIGGLGKAVLALACVCQSNVKMEGSAFEPFISKLKLSLAAG